MDEQKEDETKDTIKPEWIVFSQEYVIDWNATRSYKVAYPNQKNDNTAAANASRLLRNDKVQAYIKEIQEDLQKLAGISRLSVISKLQEIVDSKKKEEVAIRDKIKALEVINKMLGFNEPEKTDLTSGGDPIKGIGIIEWVK